MSKLKKSEPQKVKKPRDWGWVSRKGTWLFQTGAFLFLITFSAYGFKTFLNSLVEPAAYIMTTVVMLGAVYIIFKK